MARIRITSLAELKVIQAKLKSLKNTLPALQKQAIDKAANEDVLEEIKKEMMANDFSPKIIDATFVGRTEIVGTKSRTHFISDYESEDGFDVSVAREEGTRDHFIAPTKPNGVLRWEGADGVIRFSKGHNVSGIERLLIIERTLKSKENDFLENYNNNLASSVSKFLGV